MRHAWAGGAATVSRPPICPLPEPAPLVIQLIALPAHRPAGLLRLHWLVHRRHAGLRHWLAPAARGDGGGRRRGTDDGAGKWYTGCLGELPRAGRSRHGSVCGAAAGAAGKPGRHLCARAPCRPLPAFSLLSAGAVHADALRREPNHNPQQQRQLHHRERDPRRVGGLPATIHLVRDCATQWALGVTHLAPHQGAQAVGSQRAPGWPPATHPLGGTHPAPRVPAAAACCLSPLPVSPRLQALQQDPLVGLVQGGGGHGHNRQPARLQGEHAGSEGRAWAGHWQLAAGSWQLPGPGWGMHALHIAGCALAPPPERAATH